MIAKSIVIHSYLHYVQVGNDTVCIRTEQDLSSDQMLEYIACRLVEFDRDVNTNDLLFYRLSDQDLRDGITFWFSYPADVETTLTSDSTPQEIRAEFIRIHNEYLQTRQN